jgi:hypothetical protein
MHRRDQTLSSLRGWKLIGLGRVSERSKVLSDHTTCLAMAGICQRWQFSVRRSQFSATHNDIRLRIGLNLSREKELRTVYCEFVKCREIPSFCILSRRVDCFMPRRRAAPFLPATTPWLIARAFRICSRSVSSRIWRSAPCVLEFTATTSGGLLIFGDLASTVKPIKTEESQRRAPIQESDDS